MSGGLKNVHYCDNSTLKHLNLHKACRDFIANSTMNNEKPSQAALENVTAPTMAHSLIKLTFPEYLQGPQTYTIEIIKLCAWFELIHPRPFHKEQLCMLFSLIVSC